MPLYFLLGTLTEHGQRMLRNNPELLINAVRNCDCEDAEILGQYAVLGRYDRQIRIRIEGALRVGVTPSEILEIFNHLMLYGGFYITRTANRIARSVFCMAIAGEKPSSMWSFCATGIHKTPPPELRVALPVIHLGDCYGKASISTEKTLCR